MRPPPPPPISTSSSPSIAPQLELPPVSPHLLLPSEQAALGLPASPSSPTAPQTPEPKKPSRNNLFSLDWAPVTPNVPSRSSTPPVPSTPLDIPSPRPSWRAQERERELQHARRISVDSGDRPFTPPSPKGPQPPPPPASSTTKRPSFSSAPVGQPSIAPPTNRAATRQELPHTPTSPEFFHGESGRVEVRSGGAAASSSSAHGPGISDNPVLDLRQSPRLRLIPAREYLLGEGRHAIVYLGSFIPRPSSPLPPTWTLCAAKRIFADRESQLAGLGEAFILSKLASAQVPPFPLGSLAERGSQFILRLYGVKDERDGVEMVGEEDPVTRRKKAWEDASAGGGLGLGRPSNWASSTDLRAFSEMAATSAAAKIPHRRSLRRQHSFTPSDLSPLIGSPSVENGEEFFASFPHGEDPLATPHPQPQQLVELQQSSRKKGPRHSEPPPAPLRSDFFAVDDHRHSTTTSRLPSGSPPSTTKPSPSPPDDSPRMILLLEYCPFGHALSFAKMYPERMGKRRWLEWARQLVSAVAWAHERGVLHADIKPQNVLVASDLTIRLSDFGMSSFLPSASSSTPPPSDPLGLGTPPYSPPEFVRPPPSPFGRPSDIFSLGVTLSVLIAGHEPYEGMRTVERMLWVGRGGYWEWEERRREGGMESASVSRQGSIRSGRSRAGSGASKTGSAAGLSVLGGSRQGRRSESVESERSVRSVTSGKGNGAGRSSWTLAVSAKRLLADESAEVEEAPSTSPGTPSSTASFVHHASTIPFLLVPPPSPPLDEETAESHSDTEDDENTADEDFTIYANTTYSDGTPHQYFLNGEDVVPLEVRSLLKAMTSPREGDRPTAKEVLAVLDALL
ncbi:kinase-like domain-containing protein [Leucosporidium creatinivorum]|uniref:Kinase-like domain-containing protein n=1 Tax=Leucosporidium creatinivorum TaxID=106004 RepID=A0A1Y2G1Y6_9BASI|nr:kinase-like domain-containing protein [Leucosporidium creatinivorum]